jgi:hypothetical protein
MFCRSCNLDRPTYEDIISNRRCVRCARCHYRIVEGEVVPNEIRARLLDLSELVPIERGKPGSILDQIFGV